MKRNAARRGFTLVEMLVVIAIVALLVVIVISTTRSATTRSRAAADAANLRSVLALADSLLLDNSDADVLAALSGNVPKCKSDPDAKLVIVNNFPGFVDVFFYKTDYWCYGLEYFSHIASGGKENEVPHLRPTGEGYEDEKWINLTDGEALSFIGS